MGLVSKKLTKFSKNSKKSKISIIEIRENLRIPSFIFLDRRLTPLEALIKYLREEKKLSYNIIAKLLARNVRDIYKTYAHAFDKSFSKIKLDIRSYYQIPVIIFSNRKLSASEALVLYIKDSLNQPYHEISRLLNRDDRTVWTTYKRAIKKNDSQ